VSSWSITTPVDAHLNWDYRPSHPQLRTLYEKAKQAQWNASTDVDWSTEVPFGAPLPDDSSYAMASFESSPLARRGRPIWDTFRWELQSWMVSQFLHGEQGALVVAARLVEVAPDLDSKYCAASQAIDEARHVEAFSRYLLTKVPQPYPITAPLAALLRDILADPAWDITALGMQIIVEALAMAAFRMANTTFHDDLVFSLRDPVSGRRVVGGRFLADPVTGAVDCLQVNGRLARRRSIRDTVRRRIA